MTTVKQPEALRLADELESMVAFAEAKKTLADAAAELRVLHALTTHAGADGWQDISTAPKDGTEFLIRKPSLSGPLVAYYLEPEHTDWDGAEFYETWSHDPIYDATQWHALPLAPTARPLPAPPAPEALEVKRGD